MTFDEIKQLLDVVREHELSEFELERDGVTLRLRKNSSAPSWTGPIAHLPPVAFAAAPAVVPAAAPPQAAEPPVLSEAGEDVDLAIVKSPIVGTFYRAPDPESPPFVDVGKTVRKGEVLCIIEAMKLMNEIDSEYDGELVSIYVENGQPVQYGERLFAIKLRST